MNRSILLAVLLACSLLFSACRRDAEQQPEQRTASPAGAVQQDGDTRMRVELRNAQSQPVGTANIVQPGGPEAPVHVQLAVSNLPPGERAIHFHRNPQCDPPKFETAGDHFAPQGRQHGLEHPEGPHAGDMHNITIRDDGTLETTVVNDRVTLGEGAHSLLANGGTSLVIHERPDDHKTQPSGDAGGRIACGVISRDGQGAQQGQQGQQPQQ